MADIAVRIAEAAIHFENAASALSSLPDWAHPKDKQRIRQQYEDAQKWLAWLRMAAGEAVPHA